jgi:glycogen debranching enzyme
MDERDDVTRSVALRRPASPGKLVQERRRQPTRLLHWRAPRGRQNAADAKHFRHCSTAPPTRTWFAPNDRCRYPWFTDWGRDTFIALRGVCLATGRLADARDILVEWAGAVSEGMLPNRFPDHGEAPEFNSVDASLWYVVAVHELLQLVPNDSALLTTAQRRALESAVQEIVNGYAAGTRFGIRMDADGLPADLHAVRHSVGDSRGDAGRRRTRSGRAAGVAWKETGERWGEQLQHW